LLELAHCEPHLLMIGLLDTAMAVKLGSAMSVSDREVDDNIEFTDEMTSLILIPSKNTYRVPEQLLFILALVRISRK
jgi:hypothetical protein